MIILLIGLVAVFVLAVVIIKSLRSENRDKEEYDSRYSEPAREKDSFSGDADYDNDYGEDADGSGKDKVAESNVYKPKDMDDLDACFSTLLI